ncbi:MAG: hypothetical protein K2K09_04825, partial [Lachnospiraceae bacterium]|nr:hypothetical protein [Lachnospiraceae bacterium]
MKKFIKKKKFYVIGSLIVLLCAMAGTVFYVFRDNNQIRDEQGEEEKTEEEIEKEKAEMYLS